MARRQEADFNDADLLAFMGRENLEDWGADFPVMLEAWEAAKAFCGAVGAGKSQDVEIAKVLGWLVKRGSSRRSNRTAEALDDAHRELA